MDVSVFEASLTEKHADDKAFPMPMWEPQQPAGDDDDLAGRLG
jgi:hypothetical protein